MICSTAIFMVINFAFIAGSLGQAENLPSADEVLQKASELANIPGLNVSALPVEDAKTAFKKKCETNGGPEAYSNAEKAVKQMEVCTRGLVNMTVLQDEIEAAKPTGDLDIVFRRYCNKSPILKDCVMNFTKEMEPCFSQKERDNMKVMHNITESLLSFVCFKEGDRIALFISAGGPECFSSKQPEIQDCLNSTFSTFAPGDGLVPVTRTGLDNLPLLLLDTKECSEIEKLQACVVRELETCSDPTPGNIADALFNFIKKVTPCENVLSKVRADASVGEDNFRSSSGTINASLIVVALLGFFTLRFV